jgi:hypothetical protein
MKYMKAARHRNHNGVGFRGCLDVGGAITANLVADVAAARSREERDARDRSEFLSRPPTWCGRLCSSVTPSSTPPPCHAGAARRSATCLRHRACSLSVVPVQRTGPEVLRVPNSLPAVSHELRPGRFSEWSTCIQTVIPEHLVATRHEKDREAVN